MSFTNLPMPVARFFQATQAHDAQALLATFADNAVLTDMGETHQGAAIRDWNDRLYLGAGVTVQPIHVADRDGATVVTVVVDGRYEAFGVTEPFQLDWWFTMRDDRIAALRMVQEQGPDVPAPVGRYIAATNTFDLDAMVAGFAEDALVNDQRVEYRGLAAIREWAGREIVGDRVTMYVTQARQSDGGAVVVTAHMDGDYDKTGLPDPLVLTFYFSVAGERISQLIIVHNKMVVGQTVG